MIGKLKQNPGALVTVLLILLIVLTYTAGWWQTVESMAYDNWFRLRGPQKPPENIMIVEIDDTSVEEIGRPPWSRTVHAELLEKLSTAKLVAFDLIFDSPTTSEEDEAFAEALKKHGRIILGSRLGFEQENGEVYQVLHSPIPKFMENTMLTGFINFPTEKDNIARSSIPIDINTGRPYPSFALSVALASRGVSPEDINLTEDFILEAGEMEIPLNNAWQVLINFWGPARSFKYIPYYQVLNGEVSKDFFEDKIVLIGTSSSVDQDYFQTPFTRGNMVLDKSLPTPGVELHASALASYLQHNYYDRTGILISLFCIILAILLSYAFTTGRSPWKGLIFLLILLASYFLSAWLVWKQMHVFIPIVSPIVAAVLTYTISTLVNFIRTEMQKRQIQNMFGRYVSASVVDYLLEHPDLVELGGKRQEVTILFSDIRGFTSYSEGKSPEEVVERLNEYLTEMTGIVFRHGGMLDKYLGDGMMAIFGVPLPQEDHAERALAAGQEMLVRLKELNARWEQQGIITNFNIGVGINSGSVLVGNVGSSERMEYTVIGEEVNLASRLESLNKEHGTNIIFSERTLNYLLSNNEKLSGYSELGEVQVRGLVQPIKVYTPEINAVQEAVE